MRRSLIYLLAVLSAVACAALGQAVATTGAVRAALMSGPTQTFSFMGGSLPSGAALTRASTGWYFDNTPALASASTNVARFTYDAGGAGLLGLLNEDAATNSYANNSMGGAVAGTPGTVPTSWVITSTANNVTRTISGPGTENGLDYIDVRYAGTPSGSSSSLLFPSAVSGAGSIAATSGQTWTSSWYYQLHAGSLTNVTQVQHVITGRTTGGSTAESTSLNSLVPTSAALATQRTTVSRTLNAGTTAIITSDIQLGYTSGSAIDLTLRLGLPQLAQSAAASSVIRTTAGAVTRAADVLTLTVTSQTYRMIRITRVSGVTTLANVVVGGGAYVVPTSASPVQRVEFTQ